MSRCPITVPYRVEYALSPASGVARSARRIRTAQHLAVDRHEVEAGRVGRSDLGGEMVVEAEKPAGAPPAGSWPGFCTAATRITAHARATKTVRAGRDGFP